MQLYKTIKPSRILSPYIHHFWILRDDNPITITERITPIGCIQIVFHRNRCLHIKNNSTIQFQSFIGGQAITYYDVASTGDLNMIVAVLQPYMSQLLLRQPANLFSGLKVSTEDISDIELKELSKNIIGNDDDMDCIRLLEKFFTHRLYNIPNYELKRWKFVQNQIDLLPKVDILYLADKACLSERQFRRAFNENFGIPPKQFIRTIRMQRALYFLNSNPNIGFAQLAYSCDFYDQSHMIKEFRTFSGYTPTEYLERCTPISDYFSY